MSAPVDRRSARAANDGSLRSLPLAADQVEGIAFRTVGSGPTLLLLHGTGTTHQSWLPIAPLLAQRYRLLMPDLPGHGDSAAPPRADFSLDGMVARLGAWLNARDERPVAVIGHSAGAAIGAQGMLDRVFAIQQMIALNPALLPFRGLQQPLLSGAAKVLSRVPLVASLVADRARDPEAISNLLRGIGSEPRPDTLTRYQQVFRRSEHVQAVLNMMAAWDLRTLSVRLPELTAPLLLLGGLSDRAVRANELRELAVRLPNASARLLAGAGHLMHEDQPEEIARIIREWLSQLHPVALPQPARAGRAG